MAGYNEIKGLRVKYLSADPSNAEDGQVWYNSTSGNLRVQGIGLESFTSSSPLNTARYFMAGAGSQTAALSFGGDASPPYTNASEEYNGSGWTNTSSMNTARTSLAGAGTSTAGLGFGGYFSPPASNKNETEEYNGSSWSEQNNLGTARYRLAGAGTQTAGLAFGGNAGATSPTVSADTEEYNGTSWSEQNNLSQGRRQLGGLGTQTAALAFGGRKQPGNVDVTDTEEYNGLSWTSGGALPQISRGYGGTSGTQTAGLSIGGVIAPGIYNGALKYDGSTWSISPATLATGTNEGSGLMSGSTQSAGMVAGGYGPSSVLGNTEEFNITTSTFTAAAWSSGGALGTARYQMGGAGDLPAGLAYGGYGTGIGANTNKTEEYNGTSWAEQNDMSNPRGQCSGQHIGTQTAALAAGGTLPGSPNYGSACEEYNGTSWTAGGSLTEDSGRSYVAGFGSQTAGVAAGGYAQTGATSNSEEYDGSSWTAGNNRNNPASASSGTGTQTAGLAVGIYPNSSNVEEYDGTDWTNVTAYPSGRFGVFGGMGTQTDSMHAGGSSGTTRTTAVFGYDGTSFSTKPSLANALSSGASGGTSSSAFIAGGRGSPPGPTAGVTTTEEFTAETSAVAPASNLTTS